MADKVMSRAEAKAQGLTRYVGKPCKRGHAGERFVDGSDPMAFAREQGRLL